MFLNFLHAVGGELGAERRVGGHFAEIAAAPASDGEDDLKVGILFAQGHDRIQTSFVLDDYGVETRSHVTECEIDVGHQRGVRHATAPACHVSYYDAS